MKNPPGLPNLPLLQIAGHLAPETLGPIFFTIAAIARTAASSQSRSVMGAVRPSPKCRERVMRVRRVAVLKAPDPAGWLGAFGIPHVGPTKPLAHGLPNKRQLICTVHLVMDKLLPVMPRTLKSVRGPPASACIAGEWKPHSAALSDGAFAGNAPSGPAPSA